MPNISSAEIYAIQMTEQGSTPATPASGKWRLYTRSTGLYIVDDAGTTYRFTTSAELAANSGIATLDSAGKVLTSQLPALALTNIYTVASQVAQLALTTQEGDIVIRSDESKTYVRNSGVAGTIADYTLLQSPTDVVLSVNGAVGVVTLSTDNISEGSTNKYLSATDKTDLTDGGSSSLHYHSTDRDRANHTGSQLAATISDFATAVASALTGAISTVLSSNLTASKAVQSNASGKLEVSTVTTTELGYVSGVTSAIQTQLGGKVGTGVTLTAGTAISGGGDLSANRTFDFAPSELSTVTPTTSDLIVIADNSDSNNPKSVSVSDVLALATSGGVYVGEIRMWGGGTVPTGFILAYGQAISRTTYSVLFTLWGTTFGSGDGSTTFNVIDLRGRVPNGQDNMGGSSANRMTAASADTIGGSQGEESHILTNAESPTVLMRNGTYTTNSYDAANTNANVGTGDNRGLTGGSAHNNIQPSITIQYMIYTGV